MREGKQAGRERRLDERVAGRVEVRFHEVADAARALRAYSVNLSVGGICLRTQKDYAVGTELALTLIVHGEPIELTGVVAWRRNGAIGVRFTNRSPEVQRKLEALKQSLRDGA